MNAAAIVSGALLAGSIWSAIQCAQHSWRGVTRTSDDLTTSMAMQNESSLPVQPSQAESPLEWQFYFGHKATAQVVTALQFLSSLAKIWNRSADYTPHALGVEKIQSLLQNNAGFQSYATMAVSFLALDVGEFDNAIKIANMLRLSSAANSIEYFQTSMVVAFIHHYFSGEYAEAGKIYIELSEKNKKIPWLKDLGQKLIAQQNSQQNSGVQTPTPNDLPDGVISSLCETLMRHGHKEQNTKFMGPCHRLKDSSTDLQPGGQNK